VFHLGKIVILRVMDDFCMIIVLDSFMGWEWGRGWAAVPEGKASGTGSQKKSAEARQQRSGSGLHTDQWLGVM
jgi:hypothetical protein